VGGMAVGNDAAVGAGALVGTAVGTGVGVGAGAQETTIPKVRSTNTIIKYLVLIILS
jgi:hypothetical protein